MKFQIDFFNIHISHFNTTCHDNDDFKMAPYGHSCFFCSLHLGFDICFNSYDGECVQLYHLSLGLRVKIRQDPKEKG